VEKKKVDQTLKAMGVPPLVYQWNIGSLEDEHFKNTLFVKIPDILQFVTKRQHLVIEEDEDTLLAARVAVYILRYMLTNDYHNVGYLTPTKLATIKTDSWEGGENYSRFADMDLVIVDRMFPTDLDKFKLNSFWDFFESRLLNKRSTIIVTDNVFSRVIPPKIKSVMRASEIKMIEREKC
jgi:hypothetical protein